MTTAKKGSKPAAKAGPTPDPYTHATPREKAEARAKLYKNRADFFRAQIEKEESEHPEARPGWPEMKARLLLAIKADDTTAAKYAAQARALKVEEDRIEAAILARMKGGKKAKAAQDPTPEPPASIGDADDRADLWPDEPTDDDTQAEDVEILPDDEIQPEPDATEPAPRILDSPNVFIVQADHGGSSFFRESGATPTKGKKATDDGDTPF